MKAKFENPPLNDRLIITAEDGEEAEKLERWNNCVISARFDYNYNKKAFSACLTLVKEI